MTFEKFLQLTDDEIRAKFLKTCKRGHSQNQADRGVVRGCVDCYFEDFGELIDKAPIFNPTLTVRRTALV